MGSWSRKLAPSVALLLLLSSLASSSPLAALDSYNVDGNNRILSSVVSAEHELDQHDGGAERRHRHLGNKANKEPAHRAHHHNGGMHDVGVNGHHIKNKNKDNGAKTVKEPADDVYLQSATPVREGSDAKSGKASSSTPAAVVTSDAQDFADSAATPAAVPSAMMTMDPTGISENHSGEAHEEVMTVSSSTGSKTAKNMKGDDYATADTIHNDGVSHQGNAKSGKIPSTPVATPVVSYSDDHSVDHSSVVVKGSGKSGKTTSVSNHGGGDAKSGKEVEGGDAKSGKEVEGGDAKSGKEMPAYESKGAKVMDPEAKAVKQPMDDEEWSESGAGTEVKGSTKPKADKGPLTEYFIKETAYDAKSGKAVHGSGSGSGKSGKSGYSGSGKSGKDGDHDSGSGKASKTANGGADMSMSMPATEDDDDTTTGTWPAGTPGAPPPAPTTPTSPGLPVVPTLVVTPEPPTEDLLTMSPTPSPVAAVPATAAPAAGEPATVSPVAGATVAPAAPDIVGIPDPNAFYWPSEDADGVRSCEFSSNYPEGFPEDFLFEIKDECCEKFPGACPPDLLTPAGTSSPDGSSSSGSLSPSSVTSVLKSPPAPSARFDPVNTGTPTYFPTSDNADKIQELSAQNENVSALEPFGLKLYANAADPNYDEDTVTRVTMEHLVHSFRSKDWQVGSLNLMVLEHERKLLHESKGNLMEASSPAAMRWLAQHPVFELIFGGVLHFSNGVAAPSIEEMEAIVTESFTGERLDYYVKLLQEEGVDIERVKLDDNLEPNSSEGEPRSSSFNWAGLAIGMSSAIGGIGLLAFASRKYQKRRDSKLSIDDLDLLENGGDYKDYAIRLQLTNDEIEAYTPTVAETATQDQLSLPSLVQGVEEEVNFMPTPCGTNSYSSNNKSSNVSPLESPQEISAQATRYISVFTVKKDCGNKSLDQVDLRALAIAYLSRMLKKFPNTHLLPYDKNNSKGLPAITNIRNIPDDIEELQEYVGNARLDDRTGKVLFNLRVESDEPVSKMKNGGGSGRFKAKSHTAAPAIVDAPVPKSSNNGDKDTTGENEEGEEAPMSPKSPKSPGLMEDVEL